MIDESWGDPKGKHFARRFLRTLSYEGRDIAVHGLVREVFLAFFEAMSSAYVPLPPTAIGYRSAGDEYQRRGLAVSMIGVELPQPLIRAASALGLTVVDGDVRFEGKVTEADDITRAIVERRTTGLDSIENGTTEIHRPGTRALAEGDTGHDVHFLQLFLMTHSTSGEFGPTLIEGVKHFQTARGIEPTGVVDEEFWLSMFPQRMPQVAPGDGGMWVRMVQALLVAEQYSSNPITSQYGVRTTRDVRLMQETSGLRITGFIRPPEWGVLVHRPVDGFPLQ